jgi:hypothetical protein
MRASAPLTNQLDSVAADDQVFEETAHPSAAARPLSPPPIPSDAAPRCATRRVGKPGATTRAATSSPRAATPTASPNPPPTLTVVDAKIRAVFEPRTLNPRNQSPAPRKHENQHFSKIAVFRKSQHSLIWLNAQLNKERISKLL